MSVADAFIKAGTYKNILVVGAEVHSFGLDFTDDGRGVSVIFGDGAGAIILSASEDENEEGVLADRKSTRLNSSHEFVSRMPSSA